MRKKILFFTLHLLFVGFMVDAQDFKPYATAVWLGPNSSEAIYNVSYSSPNGFEGDNDHAINQDLGMNFEGRDFGVFDTNSRGLILKGAEVKTFKQNNGNTCTPELRIKTYLTSDGPPIGWDIREIPYFVKCDVTCDGSDGNSVCNEFADQLGRGPCNTSGYQKWQGLSFLPNGNNNKIDEFNLTNRKEGNYTLEIYFRVRGDYDTNDGDGDNCDDTEYDNNNGSPNNYRATYTICSTYSDGSKTDATTCGGSEGTITLYYSGLADGTDFYNGKFSHDGGVFPDGSVSVSNDVVTISGLSAGVYNNILYTSGVNGCNPVGGGIFEIKDPIVPVIPFANNSGDQTECEANPIQTLDARNSVSPPVGHTLVWYDDAINGNPVAEPTWNQVGSITYYSAAVSNTTLCEGTARAAVTLTITAAPLSPSVTINCDQGAGDAVVNVVSPTGPEYEFSLDVQSVIDGGGVPVYVSESDFNDGVVRFTGVDNGTHKITVRHIPTQCTSVSDPDISVTCDCGDGAPKLNLIASSGGTCSTTPISITGNYSGDPSEDGTVSINIESISTSNGNGSFDFNSTTDNPFTVTYTPDVSDVGKDVLIQIKTNNPRGLPCVAATAQYTLTVNALPGPPVLIDGGNQTACLIDITNPTTGVVTPLNAVNSIQPEPGKSIVWYDQATDGSVVASPTLNTVGTIQYFAATVDNTIMCEGETRAVVTLTINDGTPPTVNNAAQSFCRIAKATVADLQPSGNNILWYTTPTGGVALDSATPLSNGNYYAAQNDGGCESYTRTVVAVTITDTNSPPGNNSQSFCAIDNPTVANLSAAGENIKWYAFDYETVPGAQPLQSTVALVDGGVYYASQTPVGGCESTGRLKVTVTISDPVSPTIQDPNQVYCGLTNPTVAVLQANSTIVGGTILWYAAETGGAPLNPTDLLVDGMMYYASQTAIGCESTSRAQVTVELRCGIIAQNDLAEDADGVQGVNPVLNVLTNDNLNGQNTGLQNLVAVSEISNNTNGALTLVLDGDPNEGDVIVASGTAAGTYTLTYQICETAAPANCDTATVTVVVDARPDLSLTKTVSDPEVTGVKGCNPGYQVGSNVTFTITVTNAGLDTATNVQVTDQLPSGYQYVANRATTGTYDGLTWMIGSLISGATATLEVDAVILASGDYENTASVSADELDSDDTNNTNSVTIENNIVPVADMRIDYKVDNAEPFVSDVVTFTLTVTNDGPSNATGVVAESLLPAGYMVFNTNPSAGAYDQNTGIWSIGNVNVGSSQSLTIIAGVLAKTANDTDQIYAVRGCVNAVECDSNPDNNCVDVPLIPKPSANLVVSIDVDDQTPYVGDQVVFEMFVENLGPSIATDVELTLTLPEGHTYVSHTFKDNALDSSLYDSATSKWLVGTMDPNDFVASPILQVTTTTNPKKTVYSTVVEVWCNEEQPQGHPDHNPASDITNNRDQVITSPVKRVDLKMVKTMDNNSPSVGEQVTFTLVASNPVDLSDATGVVVNDLLPSGYTYVSDTSGGTYDSVTGIWTIGGLVSNGGSATIDIVAQVNMTGNFTNTATVTSTEDELNPVDNVASVNPNDNSDLSIQGSVSSSIVKLYDQITYTITVTNNGLSDATGVVMTDVLPTGFSYISDTSRELIDNDPNTVDKIDALFDPVNGTLLIGDLPVGANNSVTFSITGVINNVVNEYKEEKIVNTVSVVGNEPDGNQTNNTAQIEVNYQPDCTIQAYNFVSANGDGKNDFFLVDNIECYSYSKIKIFNRWGSLVYEEDFYQSTDTGNGKVFKGISNNGVGSKELPEGTYFYILTYDNGANKQEQTGYIQLTR